MLYVEGLTQGKSRRKAALDAGFSEKTAEHAVERLDSSPALQAALAEKLPSIDVLAKKICQGIDAKEVKLSQFEGRFSDRVVVDAHSEQRRYVELALQLKNLLHEQIEVGGEVKQRVIVEFQDVDAG